MGSKKFTLGALLVLATGCGRPLMVQDETSLVAADNTAAKRPRIVPIAQPRPVNPNPQEPNPAPTTPRPAVQPPSQTPPSQPAEKTPTPSPAPVTETPAAPPTRPTPSISLAGIDWGNGQERPTINGKPAPLGLLPYWHDYPWKPVPEQSKWNQWLLTEFASHKVFMEGTPQNITRFCPRYGSLAPDERKLFWLRFFSVLSEMESTFDSQNVTHDKKVGPNIYSSGLLQLSLASSQYKPYGCTMIREQRDLLDPQKNLSCGVRIMAHFLRKDGTATGFVDLAGSWLGGARYWAPLRHDYLRTSSGRRKLDEWIARFRGDWKNQGLSPRHPAADDSDRRGKGEKKLEKLIRLMNGMPICHS